MIELTTPDSLYAEILMLKGGGYSIVLLEGPNDVAALEPHISSKNCRALPVNGKEVVKGVIHRVDANGLMGVLAILDLDWVGLLENRLPSSNVVYTDFHDLDATILADQNVCKRVFSSFTKRDGSPGHSSHVDLISLLCEAAAPLGALRMISQRDGLGLHLRGFPISEVLNVRDGSIDLEKLVNLAARRSPGAKEVRTEALVDAIREAMSKSENKFRFCSGHDLLAAFAVFLRQKWRSPIRPEVLGNAVRSAFSCDVLGRTVLYREVRAWGGFAGRVVWDCGPVLEERVVIGRQRRTQTREKSPQPYPRRALSTDQGEHP